MEGVLTALTALAAKGNRRGKLLSDEVPIPTIPHGKVAGSGGSVTPGRVPNWWRAKGGRKPQAYVLEDGSIVDEEGNQVSQVSGEVAQALHLNSETR